AEVGAEAEEAEGRVAEVIGVERLAARWRARRDRVVVGERGARGLRHLDVGDGGHGRQKDENGEDGSHGRGVYELHSKRVTTKAMSSRNSSVEAKPETSARMASYNAPALASGMRSSRAPMRSME